MGWVTAAKKAVANRDLWEALDGALKRHAVDWVWVRGHAGDPLNEEVDRLAVSMIPRAALPLEAAGAVHVFCAASCLGQSGPGAWAAIVRQGDQRRELSGYEATTSANRLHVLAMVRGLEAAPAGAAVHVYTPSDYAAQGAERWARAWASSGWRTRDGSPVKHQALWQALLQAAGSRKVEWHALKDGARPPDSQRAEALAREVARS
jgi:ribonuclease HI